MESSFIRGCGRLKHLVSFFSIFDSQVYRFYTMYIFCKETILFSSESRLDILTSFPSETLMNYVDVDFKRCVKTVSCIFFHLREKTNKCSSKMNSESSNNKNSVDVLSTRYIQFFRFCT